jgi:hypothetical protein
MKSKTPIRPAAQAIEGILSRNVNEELPISSAIVGVTLLGDLDDVLAVLRTAILLARSLKAPLSLSVIGKDILSGDVDETLVPELLDSARTQLRGLNAPAFTMEVNIIAASFVSAGSITMSVYSGNPVLVSQHK